MPDIIQLLPDNLANQIAAGEVIQRPASAVKELLENAVDAGATRIQLIIQEAGKSLVQVIDNGSGMSETDARMCFERHATSKIKGIDDLFNIKTMGFRGEALASIAAVAQVVLKTAKHGDNYGTCIEVENSQVIKQEPCAAQPGTCFSMKNLFFNVPARRNFLKSNAAEMRHIVDEFIRVAMAFPNIFFSLTSNGQELFHLEAGSLKQRVIQVLGNQYKASLVPVKENTDYLNVHGFIGKPETAKKTRGDQYFFVNNRFIKSAYLNHAVTTAFEGLLPADCFPGYVLYIDLDPSQIDINVHPTKQEIKFEDEKIVYAFVQAAVKHAIGQFSIAPSLDFTLNAEIQQLSAINQPFAEAAKNNISATSIFQSFTQKNQAHAITPSSRPSVAGWQSFLEASSTKANNTIPPLPNYQSNGFENTQTVQPTVFNSHSTENNGNYFQLHKTFIVVPTADSGMILVHQQLAHERILYEQLAAAFHEQPVVSQPLMFPSTIECSGPDTILLQELMPLLATIGFKIEPFGNQTFVIQAIPANSIGGNEKNTIELLLEQMKHFNQDLKIPQQEKLLRCISRQQATKAGKELSQQEMSYLVTQLFRCQIPQYTASGSPTYHEFSGNMLLNLFTR